MGVGGDCGLWRVLVADGVWLVVVGGWWIEGGGGRGLVGGDFGWWLLWCVVVVVFFLNALIPTICNASVTRSKECAC